MCHRACRCNTVRAFTTRAVKDKALASRSADAVTLVEDQEALDSGAKEFVAGDEPGESGADHQNLVVANGRGSDIEDEGAAVCAGDADQHVTVLALRCSQTAVAVIRLSGKDFDLACAAEALLARVGNSGTRLSDCFQRAAIGWYVDHLASAAELDIEGDTVDHRRR